MVFGADAEYSLLPSLNRRYPEGKLLHALGAEGYCCEGPFYFDDDTVSEGGM